MQDQKSLMLSWRLFSGWGMEGVAIVCAAKGGHYIMYGCLHPMAI